MRAVARVGLMLAPSTNLTAWDHVRRWIRREVAWPGAFMHEGFIPGTGLKDIMVGLDAHASPQPGGAWFHVGLAYGMALLSLHLPGPDMALSDAPLPDAGKSPYPPHEVSWRRVSAAADDRLPSIPVARARGRTSAPEGALQDWIDGEQQVLWRQVAGAPEPWPPMPTAPGASI